MDLSTAERVSQIATNCAQAAAIFVGAAWAYLKFVRGRTFAYRGELDVVGRLHEFDEEPALVVIVSFKNVGLSRIPLPPDHALLYVDTFSSAQWQPGDAAWRVTAFPHEPQEPTPAPKASPPDGLERMEIVSPLFGDHAAVEPGESIRDEHVVVVPLDADVGIPLAFRARASVVATRRFPKRRTILWSASTIVPGGDLISKLQTS